MNKPEMIYDVVIDYNSMEMTRHGTYDFPVAVYDTILRNNLLGYVDWHWHRELQFCYVICGSVEFHVGRDKYTLDENSGIFINSGHLHMARPATGSDDAFVCLDFDPKLLTIFSGSVFENRYVKPFIESSSFSHQILDPEILWQKEILDRLVMISGLYKETPRYFEYDILHQLFDAWCLLLENADVDRAGAHTKNQNDIVMTMIDHIQSNYADHISLDDISRTTSYSAGECCRIFKSHLGQTIFSYIKEYRVRRSMELLLSTDLSISDIAYETGFSGTSYFIKCFKEVNGTTPHKYRTNHK